jgi:hypothetical protein
MATNLTGLKPFLGVRWSLKDKVCQKNPHTVPELKTAIQTLKQFLQKL